MWIRRHFGIRSPSGGAPEGAIGPSCTEPRPYFGSIAGLSEARPGVARVDLHQEAEDPEGRVPRVMINSGLAVSSS